ncbi:hypothetical protein EDB83DRAFT_2574422 [Lactarius deliciosus]|nr:hypothetical protein EDB83DRAFT_2574422 [Lactarius deliciosus]
MPLAGILPLPVELLEEIVDYVAESPQDNLTLRRVSKTFCSFVTPTAFWKTVIHTTDKSTQGFLELLASADVAKHVRVIQIIEDSAVPYSVGIQESGDERHERASFQRIVASLRELRFLVQDTDCRCDLDDSLAEEFWADVIGPRVVLPATNLESLSMSCNIGPGSLTRLNLSSITFPCLTSLSLCNFAWDDVRCDSEGVVSQAEDFIVRHGRTLQKLELHNCVICVLLHRPTPVRSWAVVWNRFADELSELVDLVVEYNFDQQYVYFFPLLGFDAERAFLLRGTEQDTPALEALVMIVKERKGLTSRDGD